MIDDADFDWLNQWNWFIMKTGNISYAARWDRTSGSPKLILMHRIVLNIKAGMVTDHIDKNGLNNQRYNLREATISQNAANINSQKNTTSKYLGVYWASNPKKWFVTLQKNKKNFYIGKYDNEEEAAKAYNEAAIKHHGEFANLNIL